MSKMPWVVNETKKKYSQFNIYNLQSWIWMKQLTVQSGNYKCKTASGRQISGGLYYYIKFIQRFHAVSLCMHALVPWKHLEVSRKGFDGNKLGWTQRITTVDIDPA